LKDTLLNRDIVLTIQGGGVDADMKIVILDGYKENPGDLSWAGFEELGELTVYDRTAPEDVTGRIGDAEAVITNKVAISGETMDACRNMRYIGLLSTGYNVIDIGAAKKRGITVTNIPVYGTMAVAQFAIALLLEICHHVGMHAQEVSNGGWNDSVEWCFWNYPLIELAGKTMGIIGLGRIGTATAKIAAALGLRVIAYDEHKNGGVAGFVEYVSFEELLSRSDIISLHCPLFPSTQGIINKETIAKMKDGVILINTARGGLIVERDVADALNCGKIYAAGVDVVSAEPIREDNPLLGAKNCIITPHIAWAPLESRARLMDTAVSNLKAFIEGAPVNVVNP